MADVEAVQVTSAFTSPTFENGGSFEVDKPVGSMSISPCGRDVVLASRQGLHIIDLDLPWTPPRHLAHHTPWEVADVQWSPFPVRDYWVISTSNQKALVWNLAMSTSQGSIEHVLHAHTRAITDINFSAHHPDILATCAVDSFVHCWDLRHPAKPALTFCDWFAGATQVKWNRQDSHIIASSHDKFLRIWDDRKGAHPLRSIEAHSTKIYGVDWNRTYANGIMTCSLDKTIKFWDYTLAEGTPERIIQTPFPVWRARYTPFGWGILAMPQRGDNDLHLYDRRLNADTKQDSNVKPVHRFEGHDDQVKEFLWRPRGTITDGIDNREFQLVSWGADRFLRLHRMDETTLKKVGYEKGKEVHRAYNLTRRNALYRTFTEDPSKPSDGKPKDATASSQNNTHLESATAMNGARSATVNKGLPPSSSGWDNVGFLPPKPSMSAKAATRVDIEPIAWMKGVKIGKSQNGMERSITSDLTQSYRAERDWDDFDSLGEEITYVADKFGKVDFYHINVQDRFVRFRLYGPWGAEEASVYLDCRLVFPEKYPEAESPLFSVERTASIDSHTASKLEEGIRTIGNAYLNYQRGSLEAMTRYLQGEQSIEETIAWTFDDHNDSTLMFPGDEDASSSDEGDELAAFAESQADELGLTASGVLSSSNANANVPLPKACGALWANDGRLVCFFPPKEEKHQSLLGSLGLKEAMLLSKKSRKMFEGFGNFHPGNPYSKAGSSGMETLDTGDIYYDFDSDDSYSSSSHSSASLNNLSSLRQRLNPSYVFRGDSPNHLRAAGESQRSHGSLSASRSGVPSAKTIISIHTLENIIPARRSLAEKYIISGREACKRNAAVALEQGLLELSEVWSILDLIMRDEVPLEMVPQTGVEVPLQVIARRTSRALNRKDSGVDLTFDAKSRDGAQKAHSSIKWGQHPFGTRRLIRALFSHFEQLADVQMLAMMSCVLSQYPFISPNSAGDNPQEQISGSSKHSDCDLPRLLPSEYEAQQWYWPSPEVAISLLQSETPPWVKSDHANLLIEPPSIVSSLGASSSDSYALFSTGVTPPSNYKLDRMGPHRSEMPSQGLSTSPEHVRRPQRSNSNLASTFTASLPRPFTFSASASSSPPSSSIKKRESPAGSYAGGLPPSVTWGTTSIFGRSWSANEEPVRSKDAVVDFRLNRTRRRNRQARINISLKNQGRFSDEGYSAAPLLDCVQDYRVQQYKDDYAHLLLVWALLVVKTELLQCSNASLSRNGPSKAASILLNAPPILIGRKKGIMVAEAVEKPTLVLKILCVDCGSAMGPGMGATQSKCPSCQSQPVPLFCVFCDELVRGRAAPCIGCGHVLHTTCFLRSIARSLFPDEGGTCSSGCGCLCTEQVIVEVNWPRDQIAPSSAPSTIKEADEADNVPQTIDQSVWEDVAYESLAKNLGVGGGKSLKPKTSQVWRGKAKRGKSVTGQ